MLSIIVLNYNRLEYSRQTIQTLIDKTKVEHEFLLIDNGSIDGTREYLESLKNKTNAERVECIFNPSNYGVAGGRNEGLHIAKGEYLMTIDDDILVPDNYDGYLIEACDKIEKLGITGVNVEYKHYNRSVLCGVEVEVKHGNLGGGCLCMPRRVFDQVGYFSPDFAYGGEDCDMYIRLTRLGLISAYIIPWGVHIDENKNKDYVKLKKQMHKPGSTSYDRVGANEIAYAKTGSVYVPYKEPEIETGKFDRIIKGSNG